MFRSLSGFDPVIFNSVSNIKNVRPGSKDDERRDQRRESDQTKAAENTQAIWSQVSRLYICDPALPFYFQNKSNNNPAASYLPR